MVECGGDCLRQGIDRPGRNPAQNGFELGEYLLDGVEVRTIGRKVSDGRACRLDGLADAGGAVFAPRRYPAQPAETLVGPGGCDGQVPSAWGGHIAYGAI